MCLDCHQYDVINVNIEITQFGICFYPVTPLVKAIYEFIHETGICLQNILLLSYLIIIPDLFYWSMKYKGYCLLFNSTGAVNKISTIFCW